MIRNIQNAQDLKEFTFHAIRLAVTGLGVGLLLAISPVLCWIFLPFLALYAAGYRIADGGTEWTDDVEEYLKAVEDNK